MNALVVFEEKEVREMISFFLESRFGMTTQQLPSANEAIQTLTVDRDGYDLLICEYQKDAKKILSFILQGNLTFHFICTAKAVPNDAMLVGRKEWIHFIPETAMIQGLEISIRKLFKEFRVVETAEDIDFSPIKLELLLYANPLKGNLYVKLSDQKFVKMMREGFEFDQTDIDYYGNNKKISLLYIKKQLCLEFALKIQENIFKKRLASQNHEVLDAALEEKRKRLQLLKEKARAIDEKQAEVVEIKKKVESEVKSAEPNNVALIQEAAKEILSKKKEAVLSATRAKEMAAKMDEATIARMKAKQEEEARRQAISKQLEKSMLAELGHVQQLSEKLGFSQEIQELTRQTVNQTIQSIRMIPELSELLLRVNKERDQYISSHSMLLAYISCAIASKMEWSSDTTFQKLSMASFLHDITLKNNDLAAIQTLQDLEKKASQFTLPEQKAFREHPLVAAEIARKFHEIPPDVDAIIAQHHEKPDGTGFPRALTHVRIGPLSSVFIIAHDLVCYILENDQSNPNLLQNFVEKRSQLYHMGNFKKILAVIQKIRL